MSLTERLVARALDKEAGHNVVAMNAGDTFENEMWRVHRYAEAVDITDLAGAGMKGKKCLHMNVFYNGMNAPSGTMGSVADEFVELAKRKASVADMRKLVADKASEGWRTNERFFKGVDVRPGNFKELIVRGIHVTLTAGYDKFSVEDIDDESNEPTCIAKGKRSVGQFYRWVKDNARKAQTMTFHEVCSALSAAGIEYHSYCAVD